MILSLATLSSIVKSTAIMTLIAVAMGTLERHLSDGVLRKAAVAALFSAMALVAMATPVVLSLGLIIDIRMAIAGLGAALGGPVTAIAVSVVAGSYRYFAIGGMGALPGAAGIVTAAVCGLAWGWLTDRDRALSLRDLAICGMMISVSTPVAVALLPPEGQEVVLPAVPVLVMANIVSAMVLGSLLQRERRLIREERRLAEEANLDALTGLANRRRLDAEIRTLDQERSRRRCALILFDVDHFKKINDTWGHHVGDMVLVAFAGLLRRSVRPHDLVARTGGEEFLIVLTDTGLPAARARAEAILEELRGMTVRPGHGEIAFRASAGVTSFVTGREPVAAALEAADRLLYEAKSAGRDRVVSPVSHPSGAGRQAPCDNRQSAPSNDKVARLRV